jgi:hypothetical protein
MRFIQIVIGLVIASTYIGAALASSKTVHFSSQQEALDRCGKAPVSEDGDGTFSCDMAINEKGPNTTKGTHK